MLLIARSQLVVVYNGTLDEKFEMSSQTFPDCSNQIEPPGLLIPGWTSILGFCKAALYGGIPTVRRSSPLYSRYGFDCTCDHDSRASGRDVFRSRPIRSMRTSGMPRQGSLR